MTEILASPLPAATLAAVVTVAVLLSTLALGTTRRPPGDQP